MKPGPRFLSFGVIVAVLLTIGCGRNANPISAAAATTITSTGSGTITSTGSGTITITGSGTTTSSGSGTQGYSPTPGISASTLYVVQNDPTTGASSVLELPASGQGTTTPGATFGQEVVTPTATLLPPVNTTFELVAVDASGNIYVGAKTTAPSPGSEILTYAPGATGATPPVRAITGLQSLSDIAVDTAGQIYVLETDPSSAAGSISVFASGATGAATPARNISGSLTTMVRATAIAVDAADNVYVANSSWCNILVFSSGATGNVAPSSVIAGPTGGIPDLVGVAVDPAGDVFASTGSEIDDFLAGADGTVWPTWTWTVGNSAGIAVDNASNIYAVETWNGQPQVYVFPPPNGSGVSHTVSSAAWTGSQFKHIAVY
jgi:hypothetical protein